MRHLLSLFCLLPSLCLATIIHVPADQPTIADGISAAASGDTILLAPGTYTGDGNRDIMVPGKGFYLTSEGGAAVTIIDCQGTKLDQHQAFRFENFGGTSHTIEGITIRGGYGYLQGGALYINGVSPTFKSCIFADNSGHHGGAFYITGDDALPSFYDCRFVRDSAGDIGGSGLCRDRANAYFENCVFDSNKAANGAFLCWHASPTLVGCRFSDNFTTASGGAVFLQDDCDPIFTDCLFENNTTTGYGGAIYNDERCAMGGNSQPVMTNCTFVGNASPIGSVLFNDQHSPTCPAIPSFVNCILAFNYGSPAVVNNGGNPQFSCTDIYGNPEGDWSGDIVAQATTNGDFSANPLFCDTALGDYGIATNSPCAPSHNSCGVLIGSEEPGCGPKAIIRIEKTHGTLLGHFQDVIITIENASLEMGGFDFLLAYDASALTFNEAQPGILLDTCDWEYFTYRYGADGNCGNACPSGMLRIIAMAETNNGVAHPSCYGPPDTDPHELAVMGFRVSSDRTFQGQYLPIYFFWGDCGDNTISSIHGDTMFIDRAVRNFEFEENLIWDEEDDVRFPEDSRIPFVGAPDDCLNPDPEKPSPQRFVEFINGGIDVIPDTAIDARGDINCNGLFNEIADAVMFTNYFIMGLVAFDDHVEASIAASDVNADGIALSVGDLVYLIRVITGDALPYLKPLPDVEAAVNLVTEGLAARIEAATSTDLGAVRLTIAHEGYRLGEPILAPDADGMTLKYADADGVLYILIYSMEQGHAIPAGSHPLVTIPVEGDGAITLSEVDLADYFGRTIQARIGSSPLPTAFTLHQNHPNPFNNATMISYELPQAGEVTIDVFNILGQRIRTLVSATQPAGAYSVSWDGADDAGQVVASGIYIYRMAAGGLTTEKKMVLMK